MIMDMRRTIFLVWDYSKLLLVLGAVFNLSTALVAYRTGSFAVVFSSFIIKTLMTAAVLYLQKLLQPRDKPFFYINLGLGRIEMRLYALAADVLAFFILSTLAILLSNA